MPKKKASAAKTIEARKGITSTETTPVEVKAEEVEEIQMEEVTVETNSRTTRSLEEREHQEREMEWSPSRLLPTPNPVDGQDFRYVRVSSGGTVDNMNHSQALRDHWVPVTAEECPELGMIVSDVGSADGNVVLGGMMLCKRPSWIGDKIRAKADEESRTQVDSVDRGYLSDQNASMRKFSDKHTDVQFGKK
jgi:hypothetical protein